MQKYFVQFDDPVYGLQQTDALTHAEALKWQKEINQRAKAVYWNAHARIKKIPKDAELHKVIWHGRYNVHWLKRTKKRR